MKTYDHCEWFAADNNLQERIIELAGDITKRFEETRDCIMIDCNSERIKNCHRGLHDSVNELKNLIANAADAPAGEDKK